MRSGVRLGVDVGKARIGVARCDLHGMLATPVETVVRDPEETQDIARLVELAREHEAIEIVVGLPLNLRGEHTPSTEDALGFADRLAAALGSDQRCAAVSVRLVDERLSTVSAHGQMRQVGRKTKQSRSVIDQAAAVIILQHALDSERAQGRAPGSTVTVSSSLAAGAGGLEQWEREQ